MKTLVLFLITCYKALPHRSSCRFSPSCSQYAYCAVDKYGIIRGIFLSAKRIARCHPFHKGGFDPI